MTYEQLLANVMDEQVTEFKWIAGFDNFKYLSSNQFQEFYQGIGSRNCFPTAIANAFSYFNANGVKMYDGEFTQEMYTKLYNLLSFDPNNGVAWENHTSAIKEFAKLYNKNATIDNYWLNLWSDVTRDIGRNRPILLSTPEEGIWCHRSLVLGYYVKGDTNILVCLPGYPMPVYYEYVYHSSYKMAAVNIY